MPYIDNFCINTRQDKALANLTTLSHRYHWEKHHLKIKNQQNKFTRSVLFLENLHLPSAWSTWPISKLLTQYLQMNNNSKRSLWTYCLWEPTTSSSFSTCCTGQGWLKPLPLLPCTSHQQLHFLGERVRRKIIFALGQFSHPVSLLLKHALLKHNCSASEAFLYKDVIEGKVRSRLGWEFLSASFSTGGNWNFTTFTVTVWQNLKQKPFLRSRMEFLLKTKACKQELNRGQVLGMGSDCWSWAPIPALLD